MMIETIHQLDDGVSRLDRAFAEFMLQFCQPAVNTSALRALLQRLSAAQMAGHSCIRLNQAECRLVEQSGLVATDQSKALVLEQDRLYLQRYWHYEEKLAQAIVQRVRTERAVDDAGALLDNYFDAHGDEPDWQRQAAEKALAQPVSIITGGPGTGKTTTVVKILALLQAMGNAGLAIALAAPTGKAAMRLQESVIANKQHLPVQEPALLQSIPEQVVTLHHLLGSQPPTPYFRHHADNPLPHDVVVVDEVSMVDLALMSKLVDALKPDARLILLGDTEQLSSVESGAVLADLTDALPDCTQRLLKTYRFEGDIKALAEAVNQQRSEVAWQYLAQRPNVTLIRGNIDDFVREKYSDYWRQVWEHASLEAVFAAFNHFQILCSNRRGPLSVADLNRRIETMFRQSGQSIQGASWYIGRPVMVVENNSRMQLYNGDIGLCLPDADGRLMVFFMRSDGKIKRVLPGRMPQCETCYAMTIHKSQGSEFAEVLLVLPEQMNPVLTKELLYTGITRAKQSVAVVAKEAIFKATIQQKVNRVGGLAWKINRKMEACASSQT